MSDPRDVTEVPPHVGLPEQERDLIERALRKAFPPALHESAVHGILYEVNAMSAMFNARMGDMDTKSVEFKMADYHNSVALGVLWRKMLASQPAHLREQLEAQAATFATMFEPAGKGEDA